MEYKLLEENINHVQNEVAKAKDKIAELKPMEQAKVFSYFTFLCVVQKQEMLELNKRVLMLKKEQKSTGDLIEVIN